MPRLVSICLAVLVAAGLGLAGCRRGPRTKYMSVDSAEVRGTNWNHADTEAVAKEIVAQIKAGAPWLERYSAQHGGKLPVVKVGAVVVRADGDPIHTENISLQIEAYLINSGRAEAVMAQGEELNASKELAWQDVNASDDTRKRPFQMTGTDYLIYGYILCDTNTGRGDMTRTYNVWVKCAEVETGKVVMILHATRNKLIDNL